MLNQPPILPPSPSTLCHPSNPNPSLRNAWSAARPFLVPLASLAPFPPPGRIASIDRLSCEREISGSTTKERILYRHCAATQVSSKSCLYAELSSTFITTARWSTNILPATLLTVGHRPEKYVASGKETSWSKKLHAYIPCKSFLRQRVKKCSSSLQNYIPSWRHRHQIVAKRQQAQNGKCVCPRARDRSRACTPARASEQVSERASERAVERVSEWMDGRADQGFGTVAN